MTTSISVGNISNYIYIYIYIYREREREREKLLLTSDSGTSKIIWNIYKADKKNKIDFCFKNERFYFFSYFQWNCEELLINL